MLNGEAGRCDYRRAPVAAVYLASVGGAHSICTGTLIGRRTVLTAAHCVGASREELSRFKVYSGGAFQTVRHIAVHPGWSGSSPSPNDLALVHLNSDSPGQPLAIDMTTAVLPRLDVALFSYTEGLETSIGNSPGAYRAAMMKVEDITPSYFLASFTEPGPMVCSGNSGSPAVLRSPAGRPGLIGIVSFAQDRCTAQSRAGLVRARSDENLQFLLNEAPDIQLSR